MTFRERAEFLFKRKEKQPADGRNAEYDERARAEREKTVRLRALRLARDKNLPTKLEKTRRKTDQTLRQQAILKAAAGGRG